MDSDRFFSAIAAGDAGAVDSALRSDPSLASRAGSSGVSAARWALYHRQFTLAERIAEAASTLDVFDLAALGRAEELGALIASSPDSVSVWSGDGFQALHLAAFFARREAVETLLAAGAAADLPARHPAAMRPMHSAAAGRSAAIVDRLLNAGADPNASQEGGFTALMAAAQHGDQVMAERLLVAGAKADIAAGDGRTARDLALAGGHTQLATLLGR